MCLTGSIFFVKYRPAGVAQRSESILGQDLELQKKKKRFRIAFMGSSKRNHPRTNNRALRTSEVSAEVRDGDGRALWQKADADRMAVQVERKESALSPGVFIQA